MKHLVFVYGTLKSDHGNNRLLVEGGAAFLGPAITVEPLFLADHGIPYVWTEGGDLHPVRGELYLVDESTLARLDRLEGHPTMYQRDETDVRHQGVGPARAWIYMYPRLCRSDHFGRPNPAEVIDGCYEWGRR